MAREFPNSFVLLQQEGHLFQSCICLGLAELRAATLGDKGKFYGALFNLSVGTERLFKCVLLIDHFIQRDFAFPTEADLKLYGHDLWKLYESVIKAAQHHKIKADFNAFADPMNKRILRCISEFARGTRYSNLNNLATGIRLDDPLSEVNSILASVFQSDVPAKRRDHVVHVAANLGPILEEKGSIMVASGLDGESLNFSTGLLSGGIVREAIPYLVLRIFMLLQPMREVIDRLVGIAHEKEQHSLDVYYPAVPYMEEFLTFLWRKPKQVLRAKRWP